MPQTPTIPLLLSALTLLAVPITAQTLTLTRNEATVLIEPYAPNIVRVSLSLNRPDALAAPGYGIIAKPQPTGWTTDHTPAGDTLHSSRMTVTVSPPGGKYTPTRPAA